MKIPSFLKNFFEDLVSSDRVHFQFYIQIFIGWKKNRKKVEIPYDISSNEIHYQLVNYTYRVMRIRSSVFSSISFSVKNSG